MYVDDARQVFRRRFARYATQTFTPHARATNNHKKKKNDNQR
jgi:hypothetical protein